MSAILDLKMSRRSVLSRLLFNEIMHVADIQCSKLPHDTAAFWGNFEHMFKVAPQDRHHISE